MRKKFETKTLKTLLLLILSIGAGVTILWGIRIFDSQWHMSGCSRNLSVVYDDNEPVLCEIYKRNNESVYTYGLSDCYVIDFLSGHAISLSDALTNRLEMKDVLKHLEVKNDREYIWYEAENYMIVKVNDCFVISQNNVNYLPYIEELVD